MRTMKTNELNEANQAIHTTNVRRKKKTKNLFVMRTRHLNATKYLIELKKLDCKNNNEASRRLQ